MEEYIISGDKAFVDERGRIDNYELPEPINWIGMISSKRGTSRANHYHPIQQQKCLLVSGKFISLFKNLKDPKSPLRTHIINAGDLVVTEPNIAHTMVFLEDSLFLNLVSGEREHENFGKHTIPHELVKKEEVKDYVANYKSECRVCGNQRMKQVLSLGKSPLANNLKKSKDEATEMFPLQMDYCPKCHFCQLSYVVPAEKLFDHYLYVSSTTQTFRNHFEDLAKSIITAYKLNEKSLVVDIGSNDGVLLKPLKDAGVQIMGVDPAKNLCDLANKNGLDTLRAYFDDKTADKIIERKGKADVVTAANDFAHNDKIKDITKSAFRLLKEDGVFIVEVQYLKDTLKDLTFDNIYHEHASYYSVTSLNEFFKMQDLHIVKVEHINTHGGSLRVYVKRTNRDDDGTLKKFLKDEEAFGLKDFKTYQEFARKVEDEKKRTNQAIAKLKKSGKKLVGYGSPAKATTVLNFFGINNKEIEMTIDDNKLKQGKWIPGVDIPIVSKSDLKETPDYIIVLAWNFAKEIKKNNPELISNGAKFVTLKELAKGEA